MFFLPCIVSANSRPRPTRIIAQRFHFQRGVRYPSIVLLVMIHSMKNLLKINALLLPCLMAASCARQTQPDTPQKIPKDATNVQPQQLSTPSNDHDPYFTESTGSTSPIGPNSITRNIVQDRNGTFWFASWEGIISYDGKTFTNHMNKDGLRRYHTFAVHEDRKGNLWFGTIGAGVYRFDGVTFRNFTTKDGLASDRVCCIMEDSKGVIWFGTENGISCFDGTSFRNFTAKDGLKSGDVNSIIEDRSGRLWIGTCGESYVYDGATFTPITNHVGLTFRNIRSIIQDQRGNIWFGGNDGLWRYDGATYTHLSPKFIGFIYETRDGHIWVSAAGSRERDGMSLYRVDAGTPPTGRDPLTTIHDENGQVFGILEDATGDIWFGTERGAVRYNGKEFKGFSD